MRWLWRSRVPAQLTGTLTAALVLSCDHTSQITGSGGGARLVVSPQTVVLPENQSTAFVAFDLGTAGDTIPVAVTWSATGGTISDSTTSQGVHYGRYTAGARAGRFHVVARDSRSDTATAIVWTLAPPPAGACLSQAGPSITLSGAQTSTYETTSLASSTKIDATTAQFPLDTSVNVVVRVGGGSGLCWSGGEILGQFLPATSWNTMHDKYGMIPGSQSSAVGIRIENLTVFAYGKGVSFDDPGLDTGFTIRNAHFKYIRDDCVEDDFFNGGTIDSTFLDGCYDAVSSQEDPGATQGVDHLITISNSLVRLQSMDAVYGGAVPNHNAFWKWSDLAPSLALYNNVFRADGPSEEGNDARMYMAPPPGKLADCKNNVMVWLGSGAFPETLPTTFNGQPCFTIMTGAAGLQYWNNAVAQWEAAHPDTLPDVAPPIVSLFSPGISGSTTLTGTVTIVATAVDDRAVASVQLQLNGQNIGAEVAQDGVSGDDQFGPTHYALTWDSHGVSNGTYTLTAIARDVAGHTTTSAGVTVTVSN
ncbi:MAG TPA: Ig-like domain-containing protein [Gemmatimonadales bacterium]